MNPQDLEALADLVAERLVKFIPSRLWDAAEVADYLGVGRKQVVSRYAKRVDFPTGIQLPTDKGLGELRWVGQDIIEWANRGKKAA